MGLISMVTKHLRGRRSKAVDDYNYDRSALRLGNIPDDELANAVYLHGSNQFTYLVAACDRIRWLSANLAQAQGMKAQHGNRSGLSVSVAGGVLQVHIGVDTLAHVITAGPLGPLTVTDPDVFARAIALELDAGDGDGLSIIRQALFDAAIGAIESDAAGVVLVDDCEVLEVAACS